MHYRPHKPSDPRPFHITPLPRPAGRGGPLFIAHRSPRMTHGKRIYVLDTNVLMHDPTALFKFEEHDVYLPMQVM